MKLKRIWLSNGLQYFIKPEDFNYLELLIPGKIPNFYWKNLYHQVNFDPITNTLIQAQNDVINLSFIVNIDEIDRNFTIMNE